MPAMKYGAKAGIATWLSGVTGKAGMSTAAASHPAPSSRTRLSVSPAASMQATIR